MDRWSLSGMMVKVLTAVLRCGRLIVSCGCALFIGMEATVRASDTSMEKGADLKFSQQIRPIFQKYCFGVSWWQISRG